MTIIGDSIPVEENPRLEGCIEKSVFFSLIEIKDYKLQPCRGESMKFYSTHKLPQIYISSAPQTIYANSEVWGATVFYSNYGEYIWCFMVFRAVSPTYIL